ncbi:2OG-Fe(II) oxygenase [Pararoseomonas sp. SCSIO 73927]|uniref:2OG-Fe(II) oxygenase n=1 Tax=Pararoseomonas sp. SCSIO 73927 TaxID=3114537 RepID=UPI0030D063E3
MDVPASEKDLLSVRKLFERGPLERTVAPIAYSLGIASVAKPVIQAHRYSVGCGIGAHTDAADRELRIVLSFAEDWSPENGGVWILGKEPAFKEDILLLPPRMNAGFAFVSNASSYHGLSVVSVGRVYGVTIRISI